MAGIEDYFKDPVTGEWMPPGTKINGAPNAWDRPFDFSTPEPPGPSRFATPQGGQLITTPNSSTGQPIQQAPGASSFPAQQTGNELTTTPSSRTGAPAPGIRTLPIGGPLATGTSLLAGAPNTDEAVTNRINNPLTVDDILSGFGGWFRASPQAVTQTEARPSNVPPTSESIKLGSGSEPIPVTYGGHGPGRSPSGPVPPGPPDALPPFNRGPIPGNPFGNGNVPYPPPRPYDLVGIKGGGARGGGGRGGGGRGGRGQTAPPMVNLQPQPGWTTIDRPNADVAGGRSVGGQLAPQYFNRAREPGGPAQMGAFDFSTLFNHPQVAQAAAQHPAVQAAARAPVRAAPARRPVRGPLTPGALGGSGSPTPMDIQDQTRGMYPVTDSGTPTPIGAQLGRGRGTPYDPYAAAYPYGA